MAFKKVKSEENSESGLDLTAKFKKEFSEPFLETLEKRFIANKARHENISWSDVKEKLEKSPKKLEALWEMERTGGEPDVVAFDSTKKEYIFYDTSAETPKERRNVCYDPEALASRKEHKPGDSALGMAKTMGIEILSEEDYRYLQSLGQFDLKTSSWILTPERIRKLGGGLFCDRRYDTVFTYHNGAESYYGVRGFRGKLTV